MYNTNLISRISKQKNVLNCQGLYQTALFGSKYYFKDVG